MTAVALLGQATDRIEIGTAVVPMQTRHPMIHGAAGADHPGGMRRAGSRSASGRRTTGSSTINSGCPTTDRRAWCATTSTCSTRRSPDRAPVDVDNDSFRVHSPMDVTDAFAMPVLLAALGPTMLRIAGERTDGTILWMADERAIGDHVVPRITAAAERAGTARATHRRRRSRRALLEQRGRRGARATPARCSATPTSRRTTCGCSNTATPKTSATPWPRATRRPSSRGCAATATPASPTSQSASCRSATTRKCEARRVGALNPSLLRWSPNSLRGIAPRHPQLELHLHPDDVGQKRDEGLGRMASHDDVMKLLGHT